MNRFAKTTGRFFIPESCLLRRLAKKLAREQRKLAHKLPRSKNHERQRIRVTRVHEKIANIRKDFLHQCSTRLVRENQTIAIEHLQVKNMMKNHNLAKAISKPLEIV